MNSDLKDHKLIDRKKLIRSFGYAKEGIVFTFKTQQNFRIHTLISIIVLIVGLAFQLETWEWIVITLSVGIVLVCELFNTAIERVVDLVTDDFHPLAKQAKDIGAGAVLLSAIASVLVGAIIFIPYFIELLLQT
ncbi:diacylglycerol kinase [Bacillus coahuilensis p1.1.43]|uniref:Diacylglycerol kinase n=1 Tax=Bacillus coahuilensis p1.1.43 TaxID=1150625 RepID=A0A147K7P5_9BACI|nr:diacylglycerol kinase family protein [Bacillus coahuilensis]KUP06022.1 diacylglycerol kinase [Bacillus coahuilensis p1.1.43]